MNPLPRIGSMLACALLLAAPSTQAAAPEDDARIRQAVLTTSQGETTCRRAALAEVLSEDPYHPQARWQAGFVVHQGEWVPWETVYRSEDQLNLLSEYRRQRQAADGSFSAQLALANWCRQAGLRDHEQVHLMEALDHQPENANLRRRLGERKVDGMWMSAREWHDRDQADQALRQSLRTYERHLNALSKRMQAAGDDSQRWQAAVAELNEWATGDAVPAMQHVLGETDERIARQLVLTLDRVSDPRAIHALADLAADSPWHSVRYAAAMSLAKHPVEAFAPQLLGKITPPSEVEFRIGGTASGKAMLWETSVRDRFDAREVHRRLTRIRGPERGDDALRVIQRVAYWRRIAQQQENTVALLRNRNIFNSLAVATGRSADDPLADPQQASPDQWFNWYRQLNDEVVESLPVRSREAAETVNSEEVPPTPEEVQEFIRRSEEARDSFRGSGVECFAASTPVWTEMGPMPIERIEVGDRVLAQDPLSGELAYKPVVRATIREPKRLLKVQFESHELACTPGHVFWVSGQGWKRARELEVGQRLHTVTGSSEIVAIHQGSAEATYNLEVLDFHTYFAGADKLLTRDVTSIEAIDALAPGVSRQPGSVLSATRTVSPHTPRVPAAPLPGTDLSFPTD